MTTGTGAGTEPLRPGDPRELGSYRLVGRLGRGGMGTVFLGEGEAGRRVAIKMINPELAEEESFRERFRLEVTAARRVRRFCTAPVIDARLDAAPLFIVTEFIGGPSLAQVVAERGALPDFDLEGLAVGVATALAAIHGAGIVHRDLKPANVLLSATGPRVIDFGIARALDSTDGPTLTGNIVGTPAYLAPELLRGEPVTPASDVFSWGGVMAYAGTGRAPFAGRSVPEILHRVAYEPPALDGLDSDLRALVERALDKEPANRPTTQDLLSELVGQEHAGMPTLAEAARTVEVAWQEIPGTAPTVVDESAPRKAAAGAVTLPHAIDAIDATDAADAAGAAARTRARRSWSARRPAWPHRLHWRDRRARIVGGVVAVAALAGVLAFSLLGPAGPPTDVRSVFSDNFSNTRAGWSGPPAHWSYKNGRLSLQTGTYYHTVWADLPTTERLPEQLLISVEATPNGPDPDSAFGAYCRGQNNTDGYSLLVRKDGKGAFIRKNDGSNRTAIASTDSVPGFLSSGPQKLQMACEPQGTSGHVRLRLWLDGEQVLEHTDTNKPLPNGEAGVIVNRRNGKASASTEFDNISVAAIGD
jgi:hypothetical protein